MAWRSGGLTPDHVRCGRFVVAVGEGRREIDAAGKVVAPGFSDIHTHLDAQIAWDSIASSSCYSCSAVVTSR
ncbi:MAG: amidohydrolase family protein [Bryobacterales bacterium]|nr:amidohydrolase family protein [Bryobacterales bacterium]